ncbi:MAG: extracellular solute-binding protein [Xanthobacteraceae bacterium]
MLAATRPTSLRALVAAALALLCAPGYAETLDELYAKAKDEKSLVIYAGGPVSNYEPLAREFERKFPGLTVSIEGGFSNVLNQKIEQQFKDRKLEADMVLFQTAQDFVRWKQQGKMLAFKPEGFDAIDKSFKDPDGAFIVWYVGLLLYAYNTQQLRPETAPKSALDFLKPEFRGKMIACYPHDDDATLYLFHTLAQKYGSDYIDKYLANQPNWVQGHLSVSRSVAAGTNLVTLDATTSTVLNLKKAGQPIEFVFSEVDPPPGLLLHRRHLQGRAPSQRRQALSELGAGARAAAPHRDVLFPQRRAAAGGTEAAVLARGGQRLSRIRHRRSAADRSAQAVRSRYRPDPQHRRRSLTQPARYGRFWIFCKVRPITRAQSMIRGFADRAYPARREPSRSKAWPVIPSSRTSCTARGGRIRSSPSCSESWRAKSPSRPSSACPTLP